MKTNISKKKSLLGYAFIMLMSIGIFMSGAGFNRTDVYAQDSDTENDKVSEAEMEIIAADALYGWQEIDGIQYWYENGIRQGVKYNEDGSIDLSYRGKEIYDPDSDAWYWLDNVDEGKKAVSKDVYQESEAGDWGDRIVDGVRYGKWVRYDSQGHMIKGWSTGYGEGARVIENPSEANGEAVYYFDLIYGTMAKGYCTIDGTEYYFNTVTGVLAETVTDGLYGYTGWKEINGQYIWYENGIRQGYSTDESYRGKEIYDPDSDAWYWLDNVLSGAKATSKDVYQESEAGDWGEYTDSDGVRYGKWVRYDSKGHMVKGWDENSNGKYYFDPIYGTMAKGTVEIDGIEYEFDTISGVLLNTVYSETDKILLAAIIEWEAGSEPYEGKLGVGYVVMNRVNANGYGGNDIKSVLLAKNQFSGVRGDDGEWSEKFSAVIAKYMNGLENDNTLAANDVLQGKNNPLNDAYLFFGTKRGNFSRYMLIGNHYFYNY